MTERNTLLDLFCGRWGWSRAFAKRGWHCIGVDLTEPPEIPEGCEFWNADAMNICQCGDVLRVEMNNLCIRSLPIPDAIVASPPCEEFSIHGMKHFHPHPKYPANGIRLFEHTRALCEASGLPYVIENVRAAQQFVGNAVHHCGPFYLWGNAVPPLMHRGITKGWGSTWIDSQGRKRTQGPTGRANRARNGQQPGVVGSENRRADAATIPPELANTVAEFMERIMEEREVAACK